MLQEDFVPVAIDQWYQRRQKDAEGDFWRKLASQGPRNDFRQTTQGHYVATADGTLLGFNANHVDVKRIRQFMQEALDAFDPEASQDAQVIQVGTPDPNFSYRRPADGLVIRVHSKILGGYEKPENIVESAFQNSVGQDICWIQSAEAAALAKAATNDGDVPEEIAWRIARFHLIDNTRGEPPRWSRDEVKSIKMRLTDGILKGQVSLETKNGDRGYQAHLFGRVAAEAGRITRFDMVAEGKFWGEGQFTGRAPAGKFPLAITFSIADSSLPLFAAVPHGAKGWLDGYYSASRK